jgi:hypothetical protein
LADKISPVFTPLLRVRTKRKWGWPMPQISQARHIAARSLHAATLSWLNRKPGRNSPVKLLDKLLTGYVASLNQTLSNALNFGPEFYKSN